MTQTQFWLKRGRRPLSHVLGEKSELIIRTLWCHLSRSISKAVTLWVSWARSRWSPCSFAVASLRNSFYGQWKRRVLLDDADRQLQRSHVQCRKALRERHRKAVSHRRFPRFRISSSVRRKQSDPNALQTTAASHLPMCPLPEPPARPWAPDPLRERRHSPEVCGLLYGPFTLASYSRTNGGMSICSGLMQVNSCCRLSR